MRKIGFSLCVIAALAAVGCGGRDTTPRAQQAPPTTGAERAACLCPGMQQGGGGMAAMCPGMRGGMGVDCPMCAPLPAGASVQSEPIEGGVALVFTTPNDEHVEALRQRVRAMAEAHARHHGADAAEHGEMGTMGGMQMPPSTARAVDVERGARLELRAVDEQDAAELRAHVEHMGRCPMMAGQPPDAERPPAG